MTPAKHSTLATCAAPANRLKFMPLALLSALASAGCGGGGSSTPTPSAAFRLYAAGDNVPSNAVAYFTSPLNASSTPTGTFVTGSGGELAGLAVDGNGNVIATDQFLNTITGYARPAPATSALFTITTTFHPGGDALGSDGKLYLTDYTNGALDAVSPPFTSASTPAALATGIGGAAALCFDSSQRLYVTGYIPGTITVLATPYTSASLTLTTGFANLDSCAVDSFTNQLIVNSVGASSGKVYVYNLPLTSASTPAATLAFASSSSTAVGVDPSGELYVGVGASVIDVYAPPFSSASLPLFSIPTANAVNSIAFGP